MVKFPEDYSWSSYHANGMGKPSKLWTPDAMYLSIGTATEERGEAYRALFIGHIDQALIGEIRASCNKEFALGSDRFKYEIEVPPGLRVTEKARGPKPK